MVRGAFLKQKLLENSTSTKKRNSYFVKGTNQKPEKCKKRRMKYTAVPVDYTSLLPEPLLHKILSYLTAKDAARCCVLSKRWKELRDSCPVAEFDQRYFVRSSNAVFQNFVDKFFERRLEQKCDIQIFKLAVASADSKLAPHIDRWLDIAVKHNVREIAVHMQERQVRAPYRMPTSVLSAKTLNAITLHRCRLEVPDGINLPYLTKLCLKHIKLTSQSLQKLISSCPLIESLSLISCKGLVNLEVSNLDRLNRVEVHFCKGIQKVEIVSSTLESFWYYGYTFPQICAINLLGCPSLKKLTLEDPFMNDLSFESLIFNFPYLEHLVLSKCNAMTELKISQTQLKSLILRGCKNLVKVGIHAPQLVSFEYNGGGSMLFSSLNPSSLRKAKLTFEAVESGFLSRCLFVAMLHIFLSNFDHSSGLKLVMRHKKKVAIYQHWNNISLPKLQNMRFEVIKPSTKLEDLLEHLLGTYHPEILSLVTCEGWKKKMLDKVINHIDQNGELNCCTYYTKKCWRHYLHASRVEHFTSPVCNDSELNDWVTSVKSHSELQSTTVSLAWQF
uniref:F-box domain-containing protein n=1 Tax=Kalanchoe fedtschenkoi TaxID=63787 RepID=A0A7N0UZG6_KALFE